MSVCCIKQCGARRRKNQPTLSLHRFPANETLKRKWIESIGIENINPHHKIKYICSKHFDDSCFNRTLGVIRLRDGAVPLSSIPSIQTRCTQNILYSRLTPDPQPFSSSMISHNTSKLVSHERQSTSTSNCPIEVDLPDDILNKKDALIQQQQEKIKNITRKYNLLRQKVKSLKEQVRRRNKKIILFTSIIEDIENKKIINCEETLSLQECAGPIDYLKRQISKSKGLPVKKSILRR